jgi:S-ribosylhomocysteine lyase LuxS involved in autoinducer biosynthesis
LFNNFSYWSLFQNPVGAQTSFAMEQASAKKTADVADVSSATTNRVVEQVHCFAPIPTPG